MKRMKKFLIKSICLFLVTVTTFSLCGCFLSEPKEFDVGDFRVKYQRKEDEKDPNSYLCLIGLSKAGEQKKTILLPKKINGHPYYLRFTKRSPFFGYDETVFQGKMEKFYFEYPGDYSQISHKEATIDIGMYYRGYLKKVIINTEIRISLMYHEEAWCYYNYSIYYSAANREGIKLANLQFLYNYDEAPNEGYFWIDDIDNGEKVEIMPDTPEREGYTFGGWYTEKECINEFDFNMVFNTPVLEEGDIYPEDYITYVYAKWLPNEG